MKTLHRLTLTLAALLTPALLLAQFKPFTFALLTDVHVHGKNQALQDLQFSIDEINKTDGLSFVIVSGDVTDAGERYSMELVKKELQRLHIPYYITSGNHETKWSESGCTDFAKVFGSDRFEFSYQGVYFIAFNSGPVIKMADGHVAPQDIAWLQQNLETKVKGHAEIEYVIPITHYPLQTGDVDNWFDVTDVLRQYNVQCIIGGHYHRNLLFNCDDIPDVLCRSNLRDKKPLGGYTIISLQHDSIRFNEKVIGEQPRQWLALPLGKKDYGQADPTLRPDYSCNTLYPQVKEQWQANLGIGIYSAPTLYKNHVYIGDDEGNFYCLNAKTGKIQWKQKTGSRIACTAAADKNKVVVGSTDGGIYCFNACNGKRIWLLQTSKAVMGCPVIKDDIVYIGGSDGSFRALSLDYGTEIWRYNGVPGYVETKPCIYNNKIYFGAWDCYFYALNLSDGSLAWKWSNGHPSDKFSPAAVWPVATKGRIYITAPDRVFTALDAETGDVVWRTKQHVVRETVGISEDESMIFSRCMWDSIVAMDANTTEPVTLWKTNGAYGYDHNPSMLIERQGVIIFGTKNGLLHGVDAKNGNILWVHKIGNSVLNTICPISNKECIVSSSEGTVTKIKVADRR